MSGRVLVVSHLYPDATTPHRGSFVLNQCLALQKQLQWQPYVLVRTPYRLDCRRPRRLWKSLRAWREALTASAWASENDNGAELAVLRLPVPHHPRLPMALRPWAQALAMCCHWRAILKPGFSLLHAHTGLIDGMASLLFRLFTPARALPWLITEHTGPLQAITHPWTLGIQSRLAWRRTHRLVAVSPALAADLQKELSHTNVAIVPNALPLNDIPVRASLPPAGPPWRILAVGALQANKQPLLLAKALYHLQQAGQHVTLTWVGDGPLTDELKAYCNTHQLPLNHLPKLDPPQVWQQMHQAHFLAVASRYETFSLVTAEAMACGLPVVATPAGGPQAIITKPLFGELASNATEAGALASALRQAFARYLDGYSVTAMRAAIDARFSGEQIALQLDTIYQDLLQSGP